MSVSLIQVQKEKVVAEDIQWGNGQTTQIRGGQANTYQEVSARHIPTANGETVEERLDNLGDGGYTKPEADDRFAFKNGEALEGFKVRDAIELNEAVSLYQIRYLVETLPVTDSSSGPAHSGYITKLNSEGKLSTTFHNLASPTDIIGDPGAHDNYIVVTGPDMRAAFLEATIRNATDEFDISDPTLSASKLVVTKPDGMIDSSLIDIIDITELVGLFTPTAGQEYPDNPTPQTGYTWLVTGLGDGVDYTFTGGNLAGETTKDGEFMIYTSSGDWILYHRSINAEVFYDVYGNNPLRAKLNSAGYGTSDQGDILGATVDVESGVKPVLTGYDINCKNSTTNVISNNSVLPGEMPSGAIIREGELFSNIADRKIYTVDSLGDPVLIGAAVAEDSLKLGGEDASYYAVRNGDATERFKALEASISSEVTTLAQAINLVETGLDDEYQNGTRFVPLTRTVNGLPLSTNITLTTDIIGAASDQIAINGTKFSSVSWDMSLNANSVGAAPSSHITDGATSSTLGHIRVSCSGGRMDIWTTA